MMVIQEIMVKELDQEREGSGLERSDFARKILAQGLMVERHLRAQGIKDLIDGNPKGSTAHETSEKEPKGSTAQKTSVKKAKPPKVQPSKQIGSAEVDALCDEEAPSSPSEEVSDTVPPSAPAEDFVDAILAQADDEPVPNPFAPEPGDPDYVGAA